MSLYVRDVLAMEVANQIANEHEDYGPLDDSVEKFVHGIAMYACREVLPTEKQLIDCSKEIIAMIQLSGSKADPDNEEYVQSIADTLTGSLFPYFKPTAVQDPERGFELPDV